MVIASNYPFMDIFWTMIIFFFWVMWFWCLIVVLSDVFRRHDIGGWHKAFWVLFVIILPLLGVLIYLIADGKGMAERRSQEMTQQKQATDEYIRSVASTGGDGAAAEIANAKQLLDTGAIDQAEFDRLKAKALA
jgi:ABC-type multidrug transport system fused ATPase/permease subunit